MKWRASGGVLGDRPFVRGKCFQSPKDGFANLVNLRSWVVWVQSGCSGNCLGASVIEVGEDRCGTGSDREHVFRVVEPFAPHVDRFFFPVSWEYFLFRRYLAYHWR